MGADVISSIVELAVGIACLIAAAGTWRRAASRLWAAMFLVAGVAAAAHAVVALL